MARPNKEQRNRRMTASGALLVGRCGWLTNGSSDRIHVRSPRVLRCRTSRPTIRTARIGDPRAVHCIGICDPPFDEPEDQALEKAVASPLAAPVPKPQPRLVDAETSSSVFAVLQRREMSRVNSSTDRAYGSCQGR
eukprot:Polyplicarium_translucidae@DN2132_c0_g1_i2.p3